MSAARIWGILKYTSWPSEVRDRPQCPSNDPTAPHPPQNAQPEPTNILLGIILLWRSESFLRIKRNVCGLSCGAAGWVGHVFWLLLGRCLCAAGATPNLPGGEYVHLIASRIPPGRVIGMLCYSGCCAWLFSPVVGLVVLSLWLSLWLSRSGVVVVVGLFFVDLLGSLWYLSMFLGTLGRR